MKKIIGLVFALAALLSIAVYSYAWNCENHSWKLKETIPPTCEADGKYIYVCENTNTTTSEECDVSPCEEKIQALGHDWDDGVITVKPTYVTKGLKEVSCKRNGCNETDTIILPELNAESVVISPGALTLKVNETSQWSAKVLPEAEDAPPISTWTSDDPTVATVVDGLVTGKKKGSATITASYGGFSDYRTVTVTDEVSPIGGKYFISTEVEPINAGTITGGGEYYATEDVSLKATANKGYLFTGWTLDGVAPPQGGTSETLPTFKPTRNAKYVAHFIKNGEISYTVTYRPGDAEQPDVYTDTKIENKDLRLKGSTYTKKGQVQIGWISADNTAYDLDGTYKLNSDITLYPKWAAAGEHTLTVYYNAACGNIKTGETLVRNGDTFKIKDDESATFHFTAITDYYTGSVVLNGVRQEFKDDTFTVPGKNTNQTMTVTFFSRFGNPATGDDSHLILWSVLGGVSLAAVATGMVLKKKSKS